MKKYKVFVIEEAENDLLEIYCYISEHDSQYNAEKIINKLEDVCINLETLPERGRYVPELKRINMKSFLEIIHKPFRIIYQIIDNKVFIHAILDSRRDLVELLYNRLIKL